MSPEGKAYLTVLGFLLLVLSLTWASTTAIQEREDNCIQQGYTNYERDTDTDYYKCYNNVPDPSGVGTMREYSGELHT